MWINKHVESEKDEKGNWTQKKVRSLQKKEGPLQFLEYLSRRNQGRRP